ncbi:MAG: Rrf2 family transcriptional regulator, partial [Planctomycetota bacterium]
FSKTTEYAFRASVFLCEAKGRRVPAQEIAAATHVPVRYMSKVLQTLTEAGLIESQRGPSGGFWITRDPVDMSLLDVVQAIAPLERMSAGSSNGTGDTNGFQSDMRRLYKELDSLVEIAVKKLAGTSLDSLMTDESDNTAVEAELNAAANVGHRNGAGQNGFGANGTH